MRDVQLGYPLALQNRPAHLLGFSVQIGLNVHLTGHMLCMVIEPNTTEDGEDGNLWICSGQHGRPGPHSST